jgi:arylsulfatase A-like enzyme
VAVEFQNTLQERKKRKNDMKVTTFIASIIVVAACAPLAPVAAAEVAPTPATQKPAKPNILLILADDLGYGELGCQGNPQIPTPHIDSLARNGIRFTDGYVTAPLCSPSRAGLLSGRYGQRFGFEFNLGGPSDKNGLPIGERTFAERMKKLGYKTGIFGKWHVGYRKAMQPPNRGFDWFFGFLSACRKFQYPQGELGELLPDTREKRTRNHTTEAFGMQAAAFIRKHRAEPWFIYLPFSAVHASGFTMLPSDAFPQYKDKFANIPEPRRTFAGMLSAMDDAVGTVLKEVRKNGLEENTLIFFLGDNGGPTWQTTAKNTPLRGEKGTLWEGGIRVPFLIQWKGSIPAGKVDARPVISLDLQATAIAAAGAPVPPELDGVNLLPFLKGQNDGRPHESLCWRIGDQRAVRVGDWKLLERAKSGIQLFNLAADIAEKNNLAAKHPGKLKELEAAYARWNAKNIPARWVTGKPGQKKKTARARSADLEDDN